MKKPWLLFAGVLTAGVLSTNGLKAQDEVSKSNFSVGVDVYTSYIFRGTKFGTGPSLQPSVKFFSGALTLGIWGSFDANGYTETDPYVSYSFPFGLSLGLTDYYYPGLRVFEFSDTAGSHALEVNTGFTKGGLSLSANYIVNKAGGAASVGGDKYFQASYVFGHASVLLGAGDGWHTSDGKFAVCNIGIGTTKVIKITDTYNIPVNGQVILNPQREQLYVVVGFSL